MTSSEFRRIREEMELTQAELAKKMGLVQPAVSRIECGERNPTKQQAMHIKALRLLHACHRLSLLFLLILWH